MNLSVGAKTDPGRRPNNEDQLAVIDVRRLRLRADAVLVIADGMGGRNFGERAAAAAVETVQETLVEMLDAERADAVNISDALDSALRKANARVYEVAGQTEESRGMGTTCVAAVVEGERLYLGHAGDSRAYLLRRHQLVRLTDDHSYVAEQVRAGTLSEESARRSRFRNVITRAVGIEPTISPDLSEHDVQSGDWLLLCTDGLSNMVAEPEIIQTLSQATSAQDAADRLVQTANRNGGRDNITAIVARLEAGNRTQRLRKSDLASVLESSRTGQGRLSPPASDLRKEDAPPAEPRAETSLPPSEKGAPPSVRLAPAFPEPVVRNRAGRGPVVGLILVTLLCLALLTVTFGFAGILGREGYHFQATPPFAMKPLPPPRPLPPDLAGISYGAPVVFSPVPMQGEMLTLGTDDGTITAVSVSGQVLRLAPNGQVITKYPVIRINPAATSATEMSAPASSRPESLVAAPAPSRPMWYWTTDFQGNLYVTDPGHRTLKKFGPQGQFLRAVGQGQLKQPEAVAVAPDGTIYVVDAQRLKVIRPRTALKSTLLQSPKSAGM